MNRHAWTDAQARAARPVPNVGDIAFYGNGRLTLKKGDIFLTIEVPDTKLDTRTPAGIEQQIAIEERLARYSLDRMQ